MFSTTYLVVGISIIFVILLDFTNYEYIILSAKLVRIGLGFKNFIDIFHLLPMWRETL